MTAKSTVRILVVDDDQGDFAMTRGMIGAIDPSDVTYEVDWVSSYQEALDAFERDEHDVYMVDYLLEDRDGIDLVREARGKGLDAPVIMLTGRGSADTDAKAMKAGASAYLVKGEVDPAGMERAIREALDADDPAGALRECEDRRRELFTRVPVGLYRATVAGEHMAANPALIRLLGHPDAETLHSGWAATLYVDPGDHGRFLALLREQGSAQAFETTLARVDGSRIRVRNSAWVHRTPDGSIEYVEGAVQEADAPRG